MLYGVFASYLARCCSIAIPVPRYSAGNRRYGKHFCQTLVPRTANHLCAFAFPLFTPVGRTPPPNIICPRRLVSKSNRTRAASSTSTTTTTTTNNYKLYIRCFIYIYIGTDAHYIILCEYTVCLSHTRLRPQNQM